MQRLITRIKQMMQVNNKMKNAPAGKSALGRAAARGMTLIEIMVVLAIIAMVGGIVSVAVLNRLAEAQRKVAFTQMRSISEALELYKLSTHNYPSTAEGLAVLKTPKGNEKPFMESIPKDPWDNDYVYVYPGVHNPRGFDLMSYGPDGVQGGGDDITNWENTDNANK